MVRHSLNYVSWKRRKEVTADLRRIYTAATAEQAELMLGEFEQRWDAEYLPIGQSWRRNWSRLTPFFDYPPEIRKVIYTTNAIESVNMGLRKLSKNRGSFPSDEALSKLFYLALRNIGQKWTMPIRDWKAALTRFTKLLQVNPNFSGIDTCRIAGIMQSTAPYRCNGSKVLSLAHE